MEDIKSSIIQIRNADSTQVFLSISSILILLFDIQTETKIKIAIISNNKNGLLVDFHDPKNLAKKVIEVLDDKDDYDVIRSEARKTVIKNYDLNTVCLPKQIELVESLF